MAAILDLNFEVSGAPRGVPSPERLGRTGCLGRQIDSSQTKIIAKRFGDEYEADEPEETRHPSLRLH